MRRRALLTGVPAGVLASLAGCADRLDPDPDEIEIALEPVEVDAIAEDVTDRATVTDDDLVPSPYLSELIYRLRDGEQAELEPIDLEVVDSRRHDPVYHRAGGEIYRIDETVLAAGRITGPEYEVSRINNLPDDVSPDDEDAVLSFADLPPADQWRLHEAFSFSEETEGLIFFSDSVVVGYHDPEHEANSMLLDGVTQRYLEVEGDYVELTAGDERTARVEHVRLTAERIADDPESFTEYALDRNALTADELPRVLPQLLEKLHANDGRLFAARADDEERYDELSRYLNLLRETAEDEAADQWMFGYGLYLWDDGDYYRLTWHTPSV
ncbi:hypothetical protein [Halopiger aswanensis]|uniref:Uncharacterized protein n=1 Tax=Halopiger aswanensis TaxID=148449 RepID=A0A3R7FU90_9EURY|nr:hypothetical protein [Halopiger aswanensis]RKD93537.1 hypothetical protein ATJ93_3167 [Halopiger aswanensis]